MKKGIKRILSAFLAVVMVVCAAPLSGLVGLDFDLGWLDFSTKSSAFDSSGSCGENVNWIFYADGKLVISGTGKMHDYNYSPFSNNSSILKEVVIEEGVTSIGNSAFSSCGRLTSISIPDSVTSIGNSAFCSCGRLTSISIPDSVTSIGESAFNGCSSLTTLSIPESVTSIGDLAFIDCGNLQCIKVDKNNTIFDSRENCNAIIKTETNELICGCKATVIPNSVTGIGNHAFYGCNGLTSMIIPENVTSIGRSAFGWCTEMTSLSIPDSVISIDSCAFFSCRGLTSINIPNSITCINNSVFSGCSGLTSISIPNSVKSIGDYAFNSCDGLTNISIPNSVKSIGDYAFDSCDGLTSISIPNGVTIIGDYAFNSCDELTIINIPDSVTSIGNGTFFLCTGLTNIKIPNGVTIIESWTFYNCSSLTSVIIPESVTSIEHSAFEGCSGLTNISIPDSVTSIDYSAFKGCSGLTNIKIPNGVTSIESSTFYNCSSLTSVTISESVTSIGNIAFEGCSGLISIYIPDSVISINHTAFNGCTRLECITVDEKNTVYDSRENCNAIIETEKNELISGCKNTAIPESVTSIGSFAFYGCIGLTNISIPGNVKNIGYCAFKYCSGIQSVTISEGVTNLGDSVFEGCSSLTSVKLPNSLSSIERLIFYNCTDLTTVIIPESVTSIGNSAFEGCSSLTNIIIPESVTRIGNSAFEGCSSLTKIIIPESVTSIGNSAFKSCSSLTSVIIPESITSISLSAFESCSSLTSVIIPESVTSIGNSAFKDCISLTSIKLPDSVTSIESSTFYNCRGLKSIIIPNGVTSIGNYAFYGCSNLTNIEFPETIQSIGSYSFYVCSNLLITHFPDSLEKINETVFMGCGRFANNTDLISCGVKAICGGITNALPESCKLAVNGTELEKITNLVIPSDINSIVDNAFSRFDSLKEITIGTNIESIGSNAFANCPLEIVYFKGTKAEWDEVCGKNVNLSSADVKFWEYIFGENLSAKFNPETSTFTIFGSGRMEDYSSADDLPWYGIKDSIKTVVFDGEPTSIGDYAFSGLTALENIDIPESVTSIGASAFKDCTALKTVNLPDGITEIGEKAFYNTAVYNDPASYKGNKVLYLGDNRYLIAYGNQLYGQRFNGIVNPDTVLIADGAFRGADCETVQLNEGLKYIGREAFADSSVKTVYFPESVEDCSNDIFNGCGSLTVNYGSSISDWYGMDIFLPENSVVYFTAKTEDGKVSVIYCSDDLPQEIGDISIDENSPGVTARILEKESSMTENEFKMSDHTFSVDLYENFEPIDITLKNKKGEIQPKAGRSVRVKIKAPDSVREKILEILDFKGDFDELKINKDGFYLNGNIQYFSEKRQDEVKNKIFIIHFYNKGEYMGKKNETITFKDRLELENGYLIFSVSHFSEFSFFTGCFEFVEKEINLDIGKEKKLDYIQIDDQKTLSFASSKPSVATVDSSGVVTAQKSGETVITAYCDGVEVGSCTVKVNSPTLIFSENLSGTKVDYMTTVHFSCQTENLPDGATIRWYKDGVEYAQGDTCTVKDVKESFMISVKVVAEDGTILQEKKEQIIKVKNGFFDKLLGFFRKLFGTLKTVNIS